MARTPIAEDFTAIQQGLKKLEAERQAALGSQQPASASGTAAGAPATGAASSDDGEQVQVHDGGYCVTDLFGCLPHDTETDADQRAAALVDWILALPQAGHLHAQGWSDRARLMLTGLLGAMCWLQGQGRVVLSAASIVESGRFSRMLAMASESHAADMPDRYRAGICRYLEVLPGFDPARGSRQKQVVLDQHWYLVTLVSHLLADARRTGAASTGTGAP